MCGGGGGGHVCITYHYGRVSAGADGSGGEGVERRTCVELFRAEVVRAVAQTAADGAALIPTEEDKDTQKWFRFFLFQFWCFLLFLKGNRVYFKITNKSF